MDYSKSLRFKLWDYFSEKALIASHNNKLYTKVANWLYSNSWDAHVVWEP